VEGVWCRKAAIPVTAPERTGDDGAVAAVRFAAAAVPPCDLGGLEAARTAQHGRRFPPDAAAALLAPPGTPAARNLERLLAGEALAVTTGQQPGLFTGPLYTLHKALTAAALAEALAERWSQPVVPVFWVAGDDHDFAEVNHCAVLAGDGALRTVTLRERAPGAPMLPGYREVLGAEVTAALAALEEALPPSEFRSETLRWLRGAYEPARTLAEASAAALAELLAPFGIVVCRGWHGALKRAAGGVLLQALRAARALDEALAAEARRLEAAGARVPVAVGETMSLVMLEGADGRDRLRIDGDAFVARRSGERVDLATLEALARTEPERLSGNVLLRPALEAHLFPTTAYVGGPGELAYLRQVAPVFAHLAVPRPVAVPRCSGYLVEAKVARVLERFRLAPDDLGGDEGALATALVKDALPADAAEALAALRSAVREGYGAVEAAAVRLERTLERPVETARNQALHGIDEAEKRLLAALKRANEQALQQVARARGQLFPGGRPQERVLTAASFLARHGAPLLAVLREAAGAHVRGLLEAAPRGA
jgi:bacillithiol biosynthesis cysteine-adding enzyme BshC